MDDVLILHQVTYSKNAYGISVKEVTEKQIFCRYESITRAEFFSAGRNGLNPSLVFTVFAGDYNGETSLTFHGENYAVYRTYNVPGTDDLELYAQREGGTNGSS